MQMDRLGSVTGRSLLLAMGDGNYDWYHMHVERDVCTGLKLIMGLHCTMLFPSRCYYITSSTLLIVIYPTLQWRYSAL